MRIRTTFFSSAILCCTTFITNAQSETLPVTPRKLGLTALVQQSQFDIQIPFWLSQKTTLAPSISIITGTDAGMEIGFGLVPRFYIKETVKFSPYLSPKAGILLYKPKEGDSTTDFVFGVGFGGEYFFDTNFSMGVEAQANVTKSDENSSRFGNPNGMNFSTGGAIHANVYF